MEVKDVTNKGNNVKIINQFNGYRQIVPGLKSFTAVPLAHSAPNVTFNSFRLSRTNQDKWHGSLTQSIGAVHVSQKTH